MSEEKTATTATQMPAEPCTTAKRPRRPIPADWEPPLAIGASLGDNLSRIEEAERSVLQWEAILENARQTQPFADLSSFENQLEKVRQELREMDECGENSIPINELESTKKERIQGRLDHLQETLEESQCPTAEINIKAAIEAYGDGRIQFWDKWTLLYAGHVVDVCPSYDSFTLDREERLNRYAEEHGEGWLWFEPPLAPSADSPPEQLMAATWAQPSSDTGPLSGGTHSAWDITMGFRRVRGFHSRIGSLLGMPSSADNTGKLLLYKTQIRDQGFPHPRPKETCFVEDDLSAPRCFFLMQLDSGASHPCLYMKDLSLIGIDPKTYPAQTAVTVSTANNAARAAVYEMRVDVCRHDGRSLVGDNPVWPSDRRELGGIVPVMVLLESGHDRSKALSEREVELRRRRGEDVSEKALASRPKSSRELRLSGMLPFQVCYSAGAPGMDLWFGEDRCDVLGADRMPGQRRWERHRMPKFVPRPEAVEGRELEARPRVQFDHKLPGGRRVVDGDVHDCPGASFLTVADGLQEEKLWLEPREALKPQSVRARTKRVLPDETLASGDGIRASKATTRGRKKRKLRNVG
ncbi:hypothetical protein ACJ41O_013964 [Fusarium nematophilum]